MFEIAGPSTRLCDGISRRAALKIGTFAFGATSFSLDNLFRSAAAATPTRPTQHKSVINIFLGGGPPHQDLWDLKPDAPSEIRGEMKPIRTNVPGIEICEVFPKLAQMMDRVAVIRSLVGARGGHDAIQCTTGYPEGNLSALGGRPSLGAVMAKLQGPTDPSVPPFIGLAEKTQHAPWSESGQPGFLGASYAAFRPSGPDLANMRLNTVNQAALSDRKHLLTTFDSLRKEWDRDGSLTGMDAHQQRALEVLLSSKLVQALDLSQEDPKILARYGTGKPYQFQYDGAPTCNEHFLLARRLIQAGVRCVTLTYGRWDSHSKNFDLVRDHGAKLDQALTALLEDLIRLDLLQETLVVVWGEFGRTPKINKDAGRDHWPQVSCALMAGGGLKTGQVIGSTNRLGEFAKERPVTFGEVFSTIYQAVGLNPMTTTLMDPTGRPQHLADGPPLRELI